MLIETSVTEEEDADLMWFVNSATAVCKFAHRPKKCATFSSKVDRISESHSCPLGGQPLVAAATSTRWCVDWWMHICTGSLLGGRARAKASLNGRVMDNKYTAT
jgi:hypothetical protein